ncbi:hypothetical protein [Ectothiorhodospira shaposhnikovii]
MLGDKRHDILFIGYGATGTPATPFRNTGHDEALKAHPQIPP